jgi:hypothetical protein
VKAGPFQEIADLGEINARVGYNPVRTRKGLAQHTSSSTPVVVMKPTENGDCVNAAARLERAWNRLLVSEGLVRTRFVVEADVREVLDHVLILSENHLRRVVTAERADEAFSEGIHVRRA